MQHPASSRCGITPGLRLKPGWRLRSLGVALAWAASCASAQQAEALGIHVHERSEAPAAASVGYGSIRLWDSGTQWRDLEPEPGVLRLGELQARVAQARQAGQRILLTLGATPTWASSRPHERCPYGWGCAAPPAELQSWRRYVRRIATEFAGHIECYETWNEVSFPDDPVLNARSRNGGGDPQFYSGTVQQLVALQRAAFEEIRAADPKACVLSPSFHSSGEWFGKLDRFLEAGGGAWFDRLSFHFYTGEHPPERAHAYVNGVRAVLARHGRGDAEIWNTETGVSFAAQPGKGPRALRDQVFADTLRTYLVNFGSGVKRLYWYAWDHDDELGLHRRSRNAGPVVEEAARATVAFLRGLKTVDCPQASADGLWHCTLRWGDGRVREVAWAAGAAAGRLPMPSADGAWRMWGRSPAEPPVPVAHRLDARPVIMDSPLTR
jgi:hypothetical protein